MVFVIEKEEAVYFPPFVREHRLRRKEMHSFPFCVPSKQCIQINIHLITFTIPGTLSFANIISEDRSEHASVERVSCEGGGVLVPQRERLTFT